jgi:hypothetical protein
MNKMISGLQCSTRADREKKSPVLTAFLRNMVYWEMIIAVSPDRYEKVA